MRLLPVGLVLLVLAAPLSALAQDGDADRPLVLTVEVEGIVTQGTALRVSEAIETAEDRDAPLVILLDTPGGLVDATLDIKQSIFNARVPVMAFVGPEAGAFAASAGTFILLMGVPNGMAPQTQIGSAQPVISDPQTGGQQNASAKTENFLVKQMELIAERGDRNATLAVRFITENLNMGPEEARAAGMVDVVAQDLDEFLVAVHGREAVVGPGTETLRTAGARVEVVEQSALSRVVDLLGNPQLSFIFFLVGLYALIFGLANPGAYVPETIGALMLLMGLIGLGLFDFNVAAALLIGLAAIFFIAELFTPTHGVLTVAGVIALILGVIFLPVEPLLPSGFLRTFRLIGITAAVVSGGVTIGAVTLALRYRKEEPYGQVVGASGVARSDVDADGGQVWVRGALWRAVARRGETIPEGTSVRVAQRNGLTLTVEPAREEE